MVSVEVCANSVQSAIAAQKGGAIRVELCGNLPDGGTTPAKSQIELTRNNIDIDLNVIIRPRGGDFLYDDLDFQTMKNDIKLCGDLKCDGVVIGMLCADGRVDMERNSILIEIAKSYGMSVTFHRGFDRTRDIYASLLDVINLGCDRILTSGGYVTAYEGRDVIRTLVEMSENNIVIMAGSGVNEKNVAELVSYTNVAEVHGTFQSFQEGRMEYHSTHFSNSDEYGFFLSDEERIKAIVLKSNNI